MWPRAASSGPSRYTSCGMSSTGDGLAPLVKAMSRAEFYPHWPASVGFRQTHLSYVFLAGEYVYKIKKAVRFPFVDCSTLAARYRFCLDEVRLNRRLAPAVYLGVCPIVEQRNGFAIAELDTAPARAVEYAVKMVRLPDERMLDRAVTKGLADSQIVRAIAAKVANFRQSAAAEQGWTYGAAAEVWRLVGGNLTEMEPLIGKTVNQSRFDAIAQYLRDYAAGHRSLLDDRARQGRVREGHGDLRCEHICLTDGLPIFDCVEFSERLRYCDAASEVAFLAMDLDRLGARKLSEELVAAYAEISGDEALPALIPFYKCYRACVRAKVESLKSLEPEVAADDRAAARELAGTYFALACGYTRPCGPVLIVVCGLSATGKSTVARHLHERLGLEVFSSDSVRKQAAGIAATERATAGYEEGIYSADRTRQTYDALLAAAGKCLEAGQGAILDATFRERAPRARAIELAARAGVPAVFVECRATEAEVRSRLSRREQQPDNVSDADYQIYLRQREEFEPLIEVPDACHLVVGNARDLENIESRVRELVARLSAR
jgi:uncharacterized protein